MLYRCQPCRLLLFALVAASPGASAQGPMPAVSTQVQFAGPVGMQIRWYVKSADGKAGYPGPALVAPARYNFKQGHTYRLKLTHIPGSPGLELYPTLEVPVATPATQAFLAHNAVKVEFTDEDFRQAVAGMYVVKTIYLPGGTTQTAAGPLLVIRLGSLDSELPGNPGKK